MGLLTKTGILPKESDIYDPTHPFFGNTNLEAIYYERI